MTATAIPPAVLADALQRFESLVAAASAAPDAVSISPTDIAAADAHRRQPLPAARTMQAMGAIAALPARNCPAAAAKAALRWVHDHLADGADGAELLQFVPLIVDHVPPALAADFFAAEIAGASAARIGQVTASNSGCAVSGMDTDDPCRLSRRALRACRAAGQLAFDVTRIALQLMDDAERRRTTMTSRHADPPSTKAAAAAADDDDDDDATQDGDDDAVSAGGGAQQHDMARAPSSTAAAGFLARFVARLLSFEVAAAKAIGPTTLHDADGSDDPAACPDAVWRLRCCHVASCDAIKAASAHIRRLAIGARNAEAPPWSSEDVELLRRALDRGRLADALAALGNRLDAPSALLLVSRIDAMQRSLDSALAAMDG